MAPSARHVVLEFAGYVELRFLGQAAPVGILENILAILVQLNTSQLGRRLRLQGLQALIHELRSVERSEVAHDDRPGNVRFFESQQKRWQRSDIRCVDRQLRRVDACLADIRFQDTGVFSGRIGKLVGRWA
ncbi:hypothetical protein D3C72_1660320 [compost metagenome]